MLSFYTLPNPYEGQYDLVPGKGGGIVATPPESMDGNPAKTKLIQLNEQLVKSQQGVSPDPVRPESEMEKKTILDGLAKLLKQQQQQQTAPGTINAKNIDFSRPFS